MKLLKTKLDGAFIIDVIKIYFYIFNILNILLNL